MKSIKPLEIFFSDRRYRIFFKIFLVICVAAICILAFSPLEESVGSYSYDKANHLLAFGVLAFLMDYSFPESKHFKVKMLALLVFASFIEVVQYFLPYRTFSIIDIAADILGVMFYLILKHKIIAVRSLP